MANPASTVSMNCTSNAAYNVALSGGLTSGGTVPPWKMTGLDSALLGYAAASHPMGIGNWGRAVGTEGLAGTGSSAAHALPIHGWIAAGQPGANGAPADTILITVTY
jgi:spore coat protein U-like protein